MQNKIKQYRKQKEETPFSLHPFCSNLAEPQRGAGRRQFFSTITVNIFSSRISGVFFRYLQLRRYVRQATLSYNNAFFKPFLGPPKQSTRSQRVCCFLSPQDSSTRKSKRAWEGELGAEIQWNHGVKYSLTLTLAQCLAPPDPVQVHRLHVSKTTWNNIFLYFSLHYVIAVAAEALVELLESVTFAFSCSSGFPLPLPSLGYLTLTLNLIRPPGLEYRHCLTPQVGDLAEWTHVKRLRSELSGVLLKSSRIWGPVLEHVWDHW